VFFPDQPALEQEGRNDLVRFAGAQVTTGGQAEAYASYIALHLDGIAGGATYSDLGQPETTAKAAVQAAKDSGRGACARTDYRQGPSDPCRLARRPSERSRPAPSGGRLGCGCGTFDPSADRRDASSWGGEGRRRTGAPVMEPNDQIEQQPMAMVIEDLTAEACWSRRAQVPTGRMCFVDGGEPMVLPLNHVVDGHSIVVRTAAGTARHRLGEGATVAFEADATQPATCEGWSVVVRGHLAELTDVQELADLARLPLYPWASGRRDHYLRLRPWVVTGRVIRAQVVDDEWRS
jgi:hypothetical protein